MTLHFFVAFLLEVVAFLVGAALLLVVDDFLVDAVADFFDGLDFLVMDFLGLDGTEAFLIGAAALADLEGGAVLEVVLVVFFFGTGVVVVGVVETEAFLTGDFLPSLYEALICTKSPASTPFLIAFDRACLLTSILYRSTSCLLIAGTEEPERLPSALIDSVTMTAYVGLETTTCLDGMMDGCGSTGEATKRGVEEDMDGVL